MIKYNSARAFCRTNMPFWAFICDTWVGVLMMLSPLQVSLQSY